MVGDLQGVGHDPQGVGSGLPMGVVVVVGTKDEATCTNYSTCAFKLRTYTYIDIVVKTYNLAPDHA